MSRLMQNLVGAAVATVAVTVASAPAPAFAQGPYPGGIEADSSAMLARRISMGVGKSMIVDLPRDVAEIVVGNPKIADAVVRTPRKIYVIGEEAGQTTIIGLDASGRQVANLEISIGRDVGELMPLLKAALPKSNIVARTVNDIIILTGDVGSGGEAQRAVDIAKGFASRAARSGGSGTSAQPTSVPGGVGGSADGNVINAMTIRGEEQVMLKVTVAEVERKVIKQLGFSAQSGGDTLLSGGWGKFISENPFAVNPIVSNTALIINGPNDTRATLKAFERYGVTRILAEPTVTAISGEQAKMLVGGEIAVPGSGACTVSTGGFQPVCTPGIVFKPYGVSLNFIPVVLSEGRISLRLATEVTEVDVQNSFTYANVTVPGFKTRKNETTVELPSGGSIATEGLLTQKSAQAITGVPGLLNLPILGALFRSRDYLRNETELLVVVTPYIARALTQQEVARPDDNLADASDPQGWLLGRVNRIYSTRSNPQMMQNFKGRIGFIHD
ncbi:type II and III secretion system protein family protein [Methylocystis parvus]|uniref:Type II and III secretion system protein family protein n=1 Tax=Methylocystis parvus TaxID=134 RepID=A0A6B8M3P4_9HYPH|nr:type II and III secretion system protein family protein [Methylocystis parvus]QGM98514.1 type II and III secretion system protein family protein [Methylocystis parvus]WBK01147.1 type II and III secretion system protein family protein [Methylocystis parvus OBBP]